MATQLLYEYAGLASNPPNLIFLYFVNKRKVEKIKKPFAVRITNQPKYSDMASCVALKNTEDASRLLKTTAVIDIKRSAEIINLGLLRLRIV
jgi:hypothetical protein